MKHIEQIDVMVYDFYSLSRTAKRRALNNHRFINVDNTNWIDVTLENYRAMWGGDDNVNHFVDYLKNEYAYYISDDAVTLAIKDFWFNVDGSDF